VGFFVVVFKILFERKRESEREHEWRVGREAEEEKEVDSPLSSKPDVRLDPRTLGS